MKHLDPVSPQRGIALLITLLLMSVLLGISAFLLSVTMKQFQLSSIARNSEMAFQAAEAGIECVVFTDNTNPTLFDVPGDGSTQSTASVMSCFPNKASIVPNNATASGGAQTFRYEWGTAPNLVCSDISIYKFYSTTVDVEMSTVLDSPTSVICQAGYECTVVKSRGYNTPCANITNPKTIEREITQRY